MARTCKKGIDYFSHDTSMSHDFKIKMIEAKHGIIAYSVFGKLLEKLYGENGYWLHLTEDVNILFCNDYNIEIDAYILIINDCIKYELFNHELYEKYNILTSERIQQNYCEAVKRRKSVDFIKEYLLIDLNRNSFKDLNANIKPLNVNINSQSKVNKSKVNKTKLKEKKKPSEKALQLSHHLFDKMLVNNPIAKEPNFDTWGKHVDLMLNRDKLSYEQIEFLINFSQDDEFWQQNILSTQKLRKQRDALILKAKSKAKPKNQSDKSDEVLANWRRKIKRDKQNGRNDSQNHAIIKTRV